MQILKLVILAFCVSLVKSQTTVQSDIDQDNNPDSSILWILITGFVLAFTLSFGLGANDVANVFGTSVGSKVLTLKQACAIATVAEILGAVLLGYKVSDTVRKGILDVTLYNNTEKELMLGSLAALGGSSIWNLVATYFKLPISGTHAIVGATIGFTLYARGLAGVNWGTFSKIVGSWFVSPLMSGIISVLFFLGIRKFILRKKEPLESGLKFLPYFYGFTLLVNVFSIMHDGPHMLHLHDLAWWISVPVSVLIGLVIGLIVRILIVPWKRKSIKKYVEKVKQQNDIKFTVGSIENSRSTTPPRCEINHIDKAIPSNFPLITENRDIEKHSNGLSPFLDIEKSVNENVPICNSQMPLVSGNMKNGFIPPKPGQTSEEDSPEMVKLFSFLQILTATFGSFVHGGNDVSNAIGPLIAIWAIYWDGSVAQSSETPVYILMYGGIGISIGLWVWGRRVIQTIGENLTKVTPSSGFTIEIGSAFTVLLASKIGLPVSTTHCKVGSVVFVGWAKSSKEGVDWKLFRNIVIAWIVTVPLTGGLSAMMMAILSVIFL